MITFKQFISETVIDNFQDMWEKALYNSEELRVALDLMANIKALFPSGEIYIVGGVPRDLLLGNDIDDVDLATNIPFAELKKHFSLHNISKNDTQPVYTIRHNHYNFDLAKFREDIKGIEGRQNNISTETDSFEADTKRRELTINSFGLDETGQIVDYQNGIDDLNNKIIRAVGDAKERFKEDATRILRVFRFAAKMNFDIDPDTLRAAQDMQYLLSDKAAISMESISKEFYKSAKTGKTLSNFLSNLQSAGILHRILPEFLGMEGMTHDPQHHPEGGSTVLGHIHACLQVSPYKDPVINLAVLFHDFGKATTRGIKPNGQSNYHGHEAAGVPIVQGIFNRLRFSELSAQDKKNILSAVKYHMLVHNLEQLNIKTLRRLILDPSWGTVKATAYCDEASRGPALFNANNFWLKIQNAENQIHNIGRDQDEVRLKVKKYVDGNKLMEWFPVIKSNPMVLKDILAELQDYILTELDAGREPDEETIKYITRNHLGTSV